VSAQARFQPHVSTLGQGPRRALALHCTLAFGGAWGGLAKVVGADVTLVAPDMASHGRSDDWDGTSDFSETTYKASLGAMDEGPMDIIGHSFGAAIALRMAVTHPERVRSLTLFEPVFFAVALADAPQSMVDHDRQAKPFHDAMASGDPAAGAQAFNAMWSGGPKWDSLSDRSRAAMTRAIHVVPDTVGFLYDDNAGLLRDGVLDRLKVPAILVRGEHAAPAVKAVTAGLTRRMGNAEEVIIAGAGHMAPISHPVEVGTAFKQVLARS